MSEKQELYLGAGNHLNIKQSKLVSVNQTLTLVTPDDGAFNLNVKIETNCGII